MALGNFYEIVVYIVGTPANETQEFLIFLTSLGLGLYFLVLIMELFRVANGFIGGKKP